MGSDRSGNGDVVDVVPPSGLVAAWSASNEHQLEFRGEGEDEDENDGEDENA